jgi:hypothetical protein
MSVLGLLLFLIISGSLVGWWMAKQDAKKWARRLPSGYLEDITGMGEAKPRYKLLPPDANLDNLMKTVRSAGVKGPCEVITSGGTYKVGGDYE